MDQPKTTVLQKKIKTIHDLGELIREARKSRDLSQAELAARAGVSRRLLYQLENGSRDSFPLGKVLQILKRLNLEIQISSRKAE